MATQTELEIMLKVWGNLQNKRAGGSQVFNIDLFRRNAPKLYEEMMEEFTAILNAIDSHRRQVAVDVTQEFFQHHRNG